MFAIYVHVPWCRRRCPYCDFYLVVGRPDQNYIDSLLLEWSARKAGFKEAQSLYFGGGTPSLLAPDKLHGLIDEFLNLGSLAKDAEITLEVNPEDLTKEYAKGLAKTPINRISLGIQSFDDQVLKFLGRKHDEKMAKMAIDHLLHAGFTNISVDQIIGVPIENRQKILADLSYLYSIGIPHISAYLLTIEEGTNFSKRMKLGHIPCPDDDAQADTYELVQGHLSKLSYIQYDISSFAQKGFLSRHNQVYWGQGEYIGLGPGAHSLKFLPDGGLMRSHNPLDLKSWLKDPAGQPMIKDQLDPNKALLESLAFGLRNMNVGINPEILSARHQRPVPKDFGPIMEKFIDLGWLEKTKDHLRISKTGALHADAIMREVLFSEDSPIP